MPPEIPALVSSGGTEKFNSKNIVEYRVWIHPKTGDDYYYRSSTFDDIVKIAKASQDEGFVEKPLGVIKDRESPHGYREVVLID